MLRSKDATGRRIALIGLPGAGKSAIGRLLAGELGWEFFDCDAAFEAEAGTRISTWVAANGWAAFRERETALLASALVRDEIVIATGGGVVERSDNRRALADAATVIWLDAPLEVLTPRLGEAAATRPLLVGDGGLRLAELAARRNPLYAAVANQRVYVADLSASEVTQRIADAFSRHSREGGNPV